MLCSFGTSTEASAPAVPLLLSDIVLLLLSDILQYNEQGIQSETNFIFCVSGIITFWATYRPRS